MPNEAGLALTSLTTNCYSLYVRDFDGNRYFIGVFSTIDSLQDGFNGAQVKHEVDQKIHPLKNE